MADDMPYRPDKPPPPRGEAEAYHAHPQRWPVLAVYAASSGMGALVWNILVRARLSSRRWQWQAAMGVSFTLSACRRPCTPSPRLASNADRRLSTRWPTCANRCCLSHGRSRVPPPQAYYVWYCPGSILALWVMERHGLRTSLLWGYALQLVMITLTCAGLRMADAHAAYAVVWVAQVVGSFGQPLFLNNVVRGCCSAKRQRSALTLATDAPGR